MSRNYWSATQPVETQAPRSRGRRWLFEAVGIVASLVLIAGAVLFFRTRQERDALIERTAAELRRVELEMKYRAAAKLPGLNEHGWPEKIEESWFRGPAGIPRNPLLSSERPWLDMAGPEEAELDNPLVKMAADRRLAGFWYNPRLGVVRARVPAMVNDDESLEVYNRVNGTRLASIFGATVKPDDDDDDHDQNQNPGPNRVAEQPPSKRPAIEITPTGQINRRSSGEK